MPSLSRPWLYVVLAGLASGCTVKPCDEFAAPLDRVPADCPAKPAKVTNVTPPGELDRAARRYCYATLGQVDCFVAPQPGHPGYLGSQGEAEPPAPPPPQR